MSTSVIATPPSAEVLTPEPPRLVAPARPLRIAMVGTRGVPARYGGFETAIEEVGWRLAAQGHEIVVYRRRGRDEGPALDWYRGMRLVTLPAAPVKQLETLSHSFGSIAHLIARDRPDVAVVFNAANGVLLPLLRAAGIPTVVNTDGLEWQRGKWGRLGKAYFRTAERFTARWADALIADAQAIRTYWRRTHAVDAEFIPYGAPIHRTLGSDKLAELGLTPGGYHLVVARLEPENNVGLIVDGYRKSRCTRPLVVVGSTPYPNEVQAHREQAAALDPRIVAPGAVWDQDLLDQLYAHSATYLHGHSVGGTNPSLLRAMGAGAKIAAYDCVFNREVLAGTGTYFPDPDTLAGLLQASEQLTPSQRLAAGERTRQRAAAAYDWDLVAFQYLSLCVRTAGIPVTSAQPAVAV